MSCFNRNARFKNQRVTAPLETYSYYTAQEHRKPFHQGSSWHHSQVLCASAPPSEGSDRWPRLSVNNHLHAIFHAVGFVPSYECAQVQKSSVLSISLSNGRTCIKLSFPKFHFAAQFSPSSAFVLMLMLFARPTFCLLFLPLLWVASGWPTGIYDTTETSNSRFIIIILYCSCCMATATATAPPVLWFGCVAL